MSAELTSSTVIGVIGMGTSILALMGVQWFKFRTGMSTNSL